ncbi:hypothetical protein SAMN06295885_1324 [Rathayibacter oskolensis]|uniref:Uncharacterized protein n=1 Tax=Rathayibacter oskolensis TaxID=1891671 RepID=A0A1X7NHH8_9MICO|nr:hypothetical protein [Rathayibacter oskolensis]SMH37265.1 hypothetical protein SAMN06295885_1324 [Rathayibacter oskolensis]
MLGALDGEQGIDFNGSTDEVMTPRAADDRADGRFAPEMLPVHTALALAFARAGHWSADGRDPLVDLIAASRTAGTPWALVVDDRQGVSTTLLAAGRPVDEPHSVEREGGELVPLGELHDRVLGGALPPVVLVEPRSLVDPADLASAVELGEARGADARAAEELLHTVYSAVRVGERSGRRMLLVVVGRGSAADPGEVPVLVIASGVRAASRIETPLGPSTLPHLVRARFARDPRALADPGVLALAEALSAPLRPLSRWPLTSPAFLPSSRGGGVPPRLHAALLRAGLGDPRAHESVDEALDRLRAASPGATVHPRRERSRDTRRGRTA